jgi:hypothetical protein
MSVDSGRTAAGAPESQIGKGTIPQAFPDDAGKVGLSLSVAARTQDPEPALDLQDRSGCGWDRRGMGGAGYAPKYVLLLFS